MELEYKTYYPKSWKEAKEYFDTISRHFIFRGQSNSNWDLKTSFERCTFFNQEEEIEKTFFRDFQTGAYTFSDKIGLPNRSDKLSWLALMQHHGAPTRLLDFSFSPFIASYFAYEDTVCDAAVWCIEKDRLTMDFAKKYPNYFIYNGSEVVDLPDESFNKIFEKNRICCVFPVKPSFTNKRYILQQSIFLSTGNTQETFMEQLFSYSLLEHLPEHIIKIILPFELREEALYDLNRMNINRSTLFSDIDGFALYLKNYYELLHRGAADKILRHTILRPAELINRLKE